MVEGVKVVLGFDDAEAQKLADGINKKVGKGAGERGGRAGAPAREAEKTTESFKGMQGAMSDVSGTIMGIAKIAAPAVILGAIFGQMAAVSGPFIGVLNQMKILTMRVAKIFGAALAPILGAVINVLEMFMPAFMIVGHIIKLAGDGLKAFTEFLKPLQKAIVFTVIKPFHALFKALSKVPLIGGFFKGLEKLSDKILKWAGKPDPGKQMFKGFGGPTLPSIPGAGGVGGRPGALVVPGFRTEGAGAGADGVGKVGSGTYSHWLMDGIARGTGQALQKGFADMRKDKEEELDRAADVSRLIREGQEALKYQNEEKKKSDDRMVELLEKIAKDKEKDWLENRKKLYGVTVTTEE